MSQISILTGNLGRDPEPRYLPSGTMVTNFSLATNRSYTNQAGETVKETVWFDVATFGKLAEACNEYLKKGSKVQVVGILKADKQTGRPRIWIGQDGTPHASFEVTANSVEFLSRQSQSTPAAATSDVPEGDENEIPF